jgi:hypothetical protein
MGFEHLQRRTIDFQNLYPTFKEVIDTTRKLNPSLAVLLDNVEEYWSHNEIELAAETLLDYVIEDDSLSDTYDIQVERGVRIEMLISDVVKTLQILEYVGSKRHSWEKMEILFYG